MAPNADYEYGVNCERNPRDNGSSGVRYIGRSEMVEFVCHGDEPKRKSSAKQRPNSAAAVKNETKFARVKSPKMRRKGDADDDCRENVVATAAAKPRKRCVTFQLDEPQFYPVLDAPCLPPIESPPTTPEVSRKSHSKYKPLKKASSLDEASMTRLVPLASPAASPVTSPKLSRRSSFVTTNKKQEPLSIDRFSPSSSPAASPRQRFERVDSMLKKLESLNGSKESLRGGGAPEVKRRSPPASPRTARAEKNLFVNLDDIDSYQPDRSRLKFIEAALSSTTSPRFARPGSGDSGKLSRSSGGSSGRSSPVSVGQVSLPELDADSCASGSRPASPSFAPPNSRVSTASSRRSSPRRFETKARVSMQETITSLLADHKWYD